MTTGRLESFSDGVLSVAITLLSLDLVVSGPGHGALLHQLGQRWPSFAAYAVSFVVIGIVWVNHHALVASLDRIDRVVLFLNLLCLFFVVAIPFATATMAQYLRAGGTDAHVAAAVYALVLEGMGLSFAAMFGWCSARGHFGAARRARSGTAALLRFSVGALAYPVAAALGLLSAGLTLIVVALVAVYYAFEKPAWT